MSKTHFVFFFFATEEDKRAVEYRFGQLLYELTQYVVPNEMLGPGDARSHALVVRPGGVPTEAEARAWVEAELPEATAGAEVRVHALEVPGRRPEVRPELGPNFIADLKTTEFLVTTRAVVLTFECPHGP